MQALSQDTWRQQLNEAIANGDLNGVQHLFSETLSAREWVTKAQVCAAATHPTPGIVEVLVERCPVAVVFGTAAILFERRDLGAMLALAHAGKEFVVNFLIQRAATSSETDLVKELVVVFGADRYMEGALKSALARAATADQWDMVRCLLDRVSVGVRVNQANILLWAMAISPTAPTDLVEQILALSSEGSARDKQRANALVDAARAGCTTSMPLFMKGGVPANQVAVAVVTALLGNHDAAVKFLMAHVSVREIATEFTQRMKDAGQADASDFLVLDALQVALDRMGRYLANDELKAWTDRFRAEALPTVQARLREIQALNVDPTNGVIKEVARSRARP